MTTTFAPRRMHRLLQLGSRGSDVATLQNALRAAGMDPGASDGIFGRRTAAAVRAYQQARGLGVDGIVGPRTGAALDLQRDTFEPGPVTGAPGPGASNAAKLQYAMRRARELGLTITSTTGGRHTPGSYHYRGRAADVAGPRRAMEQFYREMARLRPTELFYDPLGGIKHGQQIGAIGGHGNHVHVAF